MGKTIVSECLPYVLQNGERVRVVFMPAIEARIRATKSTETSVFFDLDVWPEIEGDKEHTRLYNVDSAYVELFDENKHL